jgi:hypothetical protein
MTEPTQIETPVDPYPECTKLGAVRHLTQAVHDFLEWVDSEHGYALKSDSGYHAPDLRSLLAEWQGIDLRKVQAEQQAIYEAAAARAAARAKQNASQ